MFTLVIYMPVRMPGARDRRVTLATIPLQVEHDAYLNDIRKLAQDEFDAWQKQNPKLDYTYHYIRGEF